MTSAKEFSVLRFSPSPEEVESVNVGVVLWETVPRLLIDRRFLRLRCVAPESDIGLLEQYLRGLESQLRVKGRDTFLASSQFTLSVPRRVSDSKVVNIEMLLKRKYLLRHTGGDEDGTRRADYIDSRLHEFLVNVARISPDQLLRRATPDQFLPAEIADRYFPENGVRFARVAIGRRGVLAADAINRAAPRIQSIERRALKVGSGFYHLRKAKSSFEEKRGQQLLTALILFGGRREDHVQELEYIEANLRRDVDEVVEADQPLPKFLELAQEITADLL